MSNFDVVMEYNYRSSLHKELTSDGDRLFILSGFQTYGSIRDTLSHLFGHSWGFSK